MSEKKQEAKPQSDKTATKETPFEIIREGTAPKLRDKKQIIQYAVGKHEKVDAIKLISNTGNGLFSSEPIPLTSIQQCLSIQGLTAEFTSRIFHQLFSKQSNSNAGFIAAVLRQEKILKPVEGKLFKHRLAIKPDTIIKHLLPTSLSPKTTAK